MLVEKNSKKYAKSIRFQLPYDHIARKNSANPPEKAISTEKLLSSKHKTTDLTLFPSGKVKSGKPLRISAKSHTSTRQHPSHAFPLWKSEIGKTAADIGKKPHLKPSAPLDPRQKTTPRSGYILPKINIDQSIIFSAFSRRNRQKDHIGSRKSIHIYCTSHRGQKTISDSATKKFAAVHEIAADGVFTPPP